MEFCEFCLKVLKRISDHVGFEWLAKQGRFRDSASYCRLCEFIYPLIDQLGDIPGGWTTWIGVDLDRSSREGKIGLWSGKSCLTLCSGKSFENVQRSDVSNNIRLAIWCDEGNPAANLTTTIRGVYADEGVEAVPLITTQHPIFTNDPAEASPLISNWLRMCLSCHEECLETLGGSTLAPGDVVNLPTRVLYIKNTTPELDVKLIETGGKQGRYCVLSHCWGPEYKRPLCTVKDNLKEHHIAIPPDKLPKTFMEALIITKSIGIDYLWIDSLCIVQDDHDEWERESATMGSLFERATLMIAASGASNSSEGCCVVQRPEPIIINVPLVDNEHRILGQCYLSPMPLGEQDPSSSPLNKRAWAFQERYMSRRKVFFMPGGIVWSCKESMLDERNCHSFSTIDNHTYESWTSLLSEYSAMELTRVSDWLPEIQGIATEMGTTKRRPYRKDLAQPEIDRGRYRFGIWDISMPTELIWTCMSRSTLRRKVPKMPSWSWVKIEGSKRWCLNSAFVLNVQRTYDALSIVDSGSLNIRGYLGMENSIEGGHCDCVAVPVPVRKWISNNANSIRPETTFFRTRNRLHTPIHLMVSGSKPSQILGFADFDERSQSNVFFSILASAKRSEMERWDFEFPKNATIRRSLKTSRQGSEADVRSVETWEITLGETYYYALLLVPVDKTLTKFRRVGLGLMYQAAWEAMDKAVEEFEII
ncbi:heterokaryon incompatibility protein-domain-containing protein [Annulohypoxylon bovei var. microspora]|nr:heterokaryon incompatibility protein-domain-containing protein [Annulohypoxylon bovei var. microspora]